MRRVLVLLLLFPLSARAEEPLTVFAAASLTEAFGDVDALWQAAGHAKLLLSFGASSLLARQIEQGAPADLFASADARWMDDAAQHGAIAPGTRRDVLGNTLVLVVAAAGDAAPVAIGPGFDLAKLLGPGGRLALADPAHVPAGIYAEQALHALGLWGAIEPRLARAEDVRAALLLVERGEAPAGIVYGTDAAVAPRLRVVGVFPASSHEPIVYPMALTPHGDTAEGRALMTFLGSDAAAAAFRRRGFQVR